MEANITVIAESDICKLPVSKIKNKNCPPLTTTGGWDETASQISKDLWPSFECINWPDH